MTPEQRQLRDWLQDLADSGGNQESTPIPRIERAWEALRRAGLVIIGPNKPLEHNCVLFRRTVTITERGLAALDAVHKDIALAANALAVLEDSNYSTDEMGEPHEQATEAVK